MLRRTLQSTIQTLLATFPAVAIVGPRQCGKTTLARQIGGTYFDLEQTADQVRLDANWDRLVAGDGLLILDEAQQAPDVFPRLRGAIDSDRKRMGRFLILGSVSPALMKNVAESLAGRLALSELSPFILTELPEEVLDDLWLFGGFPDGGILDQAAFGKWQESYLSLLAQRDLPEWGLPAKPRTTERLMRMLAAVHGQNLNASQLGSALGLDGKTLASYCDYLEGAFLLRRLQPYFTNIKKRLVKSPKLYWRDSGLLHYLQGVRNEEHLYAQPWVGHSWEGFVIEQTLVTLATTPTAPPAWFFRTSDGYELDLVIEHGKDRWAVEIKLTSAPSPDAISRLEKTAALIDATRKVLVCRVAEEIETDRLLVTNLPAWLQRVTDVVTS